MTLEEYLLENQYEIFEYTAAVAFESKIYTLSGKKLLDKIKSAYHGDIRFRLDSGVYFLYNRLLAQPKVSKTKMDLIDTKIRIADEV